MSKKSERSHLSRSKRKKSKSIAVPVTTQQRPVSPVASVSSAETPPAVAIVKEKKGTSVEARYTDVSYELRRIGMLAAIMLVVLVVLALILP